MKRSNTTFRVLIYDINRCCIEFADVFSLGCWHDMESKLRASLRKLRKAEPEYLKQELETFRASSSSAFGYGFDKVGKDTIRILLECYLERMCKSMFWARFEFETYVHGIHSPDTKLDVYEQLKANWDVFVGIVLGRIGYEV